MCAFFEICYNFFWCRDEVDFFCFFQTRVLVELCPMAVALAGEGAWGRRSRRVNGMGDGLYSVVRYAVDDLFFRQPDSGRYLVMLSSLVAKSSAGYWAIV